MVLFHGAAPLCVPVVHLQEDSDEEEEEEEEEEDTDEDDEPSEWSSSSPSFAPTCLHRAPHPSLLEQRWRLMRRIQ